MISIIVSSYNKELFNKFSLSIAQTIGSEYEIIQVWNPGIMGVTEAYNIGASKAIYDYLIFCHEDITFETMDWGNILIEHFRLNKEVGLIGVAGSYSVPLFPFPWFFDEKNVFLSINQYDKSELIFKKRDTVKISNKPLILDGVFLSCEASKFREIGFSRELKGYHCYDIDISLRFSERFKNMFVENIILNHYSLGNFYSNWSEEAIKCWYINRSLIRKYSKFNILQIKLLNYYLANLGYGRNRRVYHLIKYIIRCFFY